MLQQSHVTLSNGLQSFAEASPEYELAPLGVASMPSQLQKLSEYGRNGDIYIVHAAEGETVIPMEVLDANPKIKALLFGQMRDMGLDPQEFVVGDELNSINPDTGLPEFFFKSIFRKVKNVVSKVWKGFKKAAPVVLPIAAAMFGVPFLGGGMFGSTMAGIFGPGMAGSSMLASGVGSLLSGGSLKDAFKSAAFAGGMSGILGGLKGAGAFSGFGVPGGGEGFIEGAKSAFYNPDMYTAGITPASQWDQLTKALKGGKGNEGAWGRFFEPVVGGGKDPITGELYPSGLTPRPDYMPKPQVGAGTGPLNLRGATVLGTRTDAPLFPKTDAAGNVLHAPEMVGDTTQLAAAPAPAAPAPRSPLSPGIGKAHSTALGMDPSVLKGKIPLDSTGPFGTGEWGGTAKRFLFGPKYTGADVIKATYGTTGLPVAQTTGDILALEKIHAAAAKAAQGASAGLARTYGPLAGAGALAAYGMGALDEKKPPDDPDESDLTFMRKMGKSAQERLAEDRERIARGEDPKYYLPPQAVDPLHAWRPEDYEYQNYYATAADGGLATYPRRENLVEGPGTERSDDIPAMLSDGEFVMNSRAVRGADPTGGNNRYAGAKNLYNMMRNFEMRA
jgi:hypothetical protein